MILRNNDNITGAIALFDPVTDAVHERQLSPRYLEVVAPFIAREYLNTQALNEAERSAGIMHTVLNTCDIGIAAFRFDAPDQVLFYNSACTKYCFDFFPNGTASKAIISDFIRSIISFNPFVTNICGLNIELKSPSGNRYSVRVIDDSKRWDCSILIISPVSVTSDFYAAGVTDLFSLLSAREREIVQLIAEGKTNREIAQKLFISESTVKGHIQHIFEKAKVSNRTSLLALLHE